MDENVYILEIVIKKKDSYRYVDNWDKYLVAP
jgi:hypothetical protein